MNNYFGRLVETQRKGSQKDHTESFEPILTCQVQAPRDHEVETQERFGMRHFKR
jgi:hypothetical protein